MTNESTPASPSPARSDMPAEWLPTAANVNALPEGVRRYVHDLETRCDPAGDVAALTGLRDQLAGVQIMYRKAADALAEVRGCFEAAEVEGLAAALAGTSDEHLKDLVERRLMHALAATQGTPTGMAESAPSSAAPQVPCTYQQTEKERGAIEAYGRACVAEYRRATAPDSESIDGPEFWQLLSDYAFAARNSGEVQTIRAARKIIAYIDARRATAGTTLPTESKAGEGGASALRAEPASQHDSIIGQLAHALRNANLLLAETFISTGKAMSDRAANVSRQIERALADADEELLAPGSARGRNTCNKGTSEFAATAVSGDPPEPIWNPLDTPEFREVLGAYVKASEKVSLVRPESIAAYDAARKALTDFIEAWGVKEAARLASNAGAAK